MLTIWFNRAYATTAHVISLLRDNPDGIPVRIVATHADPVSPVMLAADVTEPEPAEDVRGEDYVAWALDLCARHGVDVFVPRLHLDTVAAARDRFTAAGVAVVAGPARAAALLEDKAAAYADAERAGIPVPPHHVVRTGDELVAAYAALAAVTPRVCLKPVAGVGGQGFRTLTTAPLSLDELLAHPTARVTLDEAVEALDKAGPEATPPLLVMPYLPGPEVSVDCLATPAGTVLAALPRVKVGRERRLVEDPAAVEVARTLVERHRLGLLSNTQVRYWQHPLLDDGPRPYYLETNARMSGGLYQTAASGLNLPWAAVRLARGLDAGLGEPRLGARWTTVESMVPLG